MYLKFFMAIFLLIIICEVHAKDSDTQMEIKKTDSKTIYDQRQTGKYNVHVNIKDVQFFSIKDALSSLGDYGSYDYGDYEMEGGDTSDYDISHLTVSPIFAFLGAHSKPTKPSTISSTTEKLQSIIDTSTASQEALSLTNKEEMTSTKQELEETTVKKENISNFLTSTTEKPALKPLKVNESIDYEEIPVEVQYYRANQSKLPLVYASSLQNSNNNHNNRPAINLKRHRRPSVVQILDGRVNNNVKIVESDEQVRTVKICGRGEFRDSHGRCRIKAHNRVPGLRRVFNVISSLLPNSK